MNGTRYRTDRDHGETAHIGMFVYFTAIYCMLFFLLYCVVLVTIYTRNGLFVCIRGIYCITEMWKVYLANNEWQSDWFRSGLTRHREKTNPRLDYLGKHRRPLQNCYFRGGTHSYLWVFQIIPAFVHLSNNQSIYLSDAPVQKPIDSCE